MDNIGQGTAHYYASNANSTLCCLIEAQCKRFKAAVLNSLRWGLELHVLACQCMCYVYNNLLLFLNAVPWCGTLQHCRCTTLVLPVTHDAKAVL
jgi:hypothetical protein